MTFRTTQSSSHPAAEVLALYSRGDLRWFNRMKVRKHVLECAECEHELSQLVSSTAELKREAATETLTAFEAIADWTTLEREMLGNVVVGVAAARCIEKVGRRRGWIPKLAMATGLAGLFVAGWMTHIPREQSRNLAGTVFGFLHRAPGEGNIVETTQTGIAARSQGVTLTIMHPPSAVVSVSGTASVEARYVDEDTGQLTITNVYGE